MALTYHKATADTGGSIGAEILSGEIDALLPEVILSAQASGESVARKFYIANDGAEDVNISNLSMNTYAVFPVILFASSGDAQVVGDLTGSEADESPISVVIPAGGHMSFWVRRDVPASSVKTESFGSADLKRTL